VHCDVKAANVMLGPGPAKLIDFGIAQPPHQGLEGDTSIGTLPAMSPEQLHGEALTGASDLFSLGTVLYEALTGRVAYPGRTPQEVSAAHAAGSPAPPSTIVPGLPERLDAVVLQSLRREPGARFHTATAMARALEAAAGEDPDAQDETRVIRTPAAATPPPDAPQPERGYVPPPVPDHLPPAPPPPGRAPRRRPPVSRQRSSRWGMAGTLLVLGAAALVVALVVVPLLDLGGRGGSGEVEPSASPAPVASVAPDIIPDTIGLPTDEAIAVARAAGLDWTVRCNQDPQLPEGIVDQEPPAGTEVAPGSAFTMFSARVQDCR
jgi:serine/threonine-protein kinase